MRFIRQALDNHLLTMPPSIDVAWSTITYEPGSAPYLRPSFLPAQPSAAALGEAAYNRVTGVYQVDVFYPHDQVYLAEQTADEIITRFQRGVAINYRPNSTIVEFCVQCISAGLLPRYIDGGRVAYPVNVQWRCDYPLDPTVASTLFVHSEAGGYYKPDGARWQDAGQTLPADDSGEPLRVWTPSYGPDDAVAPDDPSRPTLT